ncbi:cadmium-translocating P-type ATPase [Georhizobium profundi]|uniref:Cadmium-translocating P-type ATPase n=1 Tax=Georhizobium profundi TaxID=2341112 RepID=A0A3S9B7G5_9HYPH|nr:cation-translocating P-type ATPase [Georhizobium profundi]AZN72908.1 cadmium-translocating P-type ATPase [Georhizobium profundi]
MSCCAPGAETLPSQSLPSDEELLLVSRPLGNGLRQVDLSVPGVHCAACIRTIEKALASLPGVENARVNLSTKRVSVRFYEGTVPPVTSTLAAVGYPAHLAEDTADDGDPELSRLLRAVGISGFAAGNIMLLSVSVWSGAEGATRDLFHFVSALIALPALIYAGGIYFRSAWNALSHGRMNMDVPIAVGVSLAYAMSLYETITNGPHAYFDASVSLLFFLLIGRTLDHVMRNRARTAVRNLARIAPRGALVIEPDGERRYRPVSEIEPGIRLLIAAGDRIPVDGLIETGASDVDMALVTGESRPIRVDSGASVRAGALNVTGPLTLVAERRASDSFLADMLRMLETAEGGRAGYRRIAERVSALYAPVVHLGALLTFLGWMAFGGDWHRAMTIAIAVLIITCPCALGLAVPIVQVVAARRLFEAGIMVKDGSAMERLAEADHVIFDKTGTLTLGEMRLTNADAIKPAMLARAGALARQSRHPASRAIAGAAGDDWGGTLTDIREVPGDGIEGHDADGVWRLGRADWARHDGNGSGTVLTVDGTEKARFSFEDRLRPGAAQAVAALASVGPVEMLSGDTGDACRKVAEVAGILDWHPGMLPSDKLQRIAALEREGRKVLMVGDGINDAPALAAAHVSIAPSEAADIGRAAADFVFMKGSLDAVPFARSIALQANRLVRQNIGFAIAYNVVAVPIAVLGHATPLIAAIAMSASSLIVIANALRLGFAAKRPGASAGQAIQREALA